jgi:hypothetical protein
MAYMYEGRARGPGVRGPDASVEGQAQLGSNPLENGIEIFGRLGVREARDADAKAFEDLRPAGVVVGGPLMLLAVPRIAVRGSTTSFAAWR